MNIIQSRQRVGGFQRALKDSLVEIAEKSASTQAFMISRTFGSLDWVRVMPLPELGVTRSGDRNAARDFTVAEDAAYAENRIADDYVSRLRGEGPSVRLHIVEVETNENCLPAVRRWRRPSGRPIQAPGRPRTRSPSDL